MSHSDPFSSVTLLCELLSLEYPKQVERVVGVPRELDPAQLLTSGIAVRVEGGPMAAVAEELDQGQLAGLPLMPFPVTLFEIYMDGKGGVLFDHSETQGGLVAFAVVEDDPGKRWRVVGYAIREEDDAVPRVIYVPALIYVDDDGVVNETLTSVEGDVEYLRNDPTTSLLIACGLLAEARGTKIMPWQEDVVSADSRQVRRARERAFEKQKVCPPEIYTLVIGGTRYEKLASDGDGREYTCRWLVRGHWRHLPSGKRTRVVSHIKGPADAPFKGRPQYTVVDE